MRSLTMTFVKCIHKKRTWSDRTGVQIDFHIRFHTVYTVDSRYLEFQGTLKYFEISVLKIRFVELRKN